MIETGVEKLYVLSVSLADEVTDLQDGLPVCLQQKLACGLV